MSTPIDLGTDQLHIVSGNFPKGAQLGHSEVGIQTHVWGGTLEHL